MDDNFNCLYYVFRISRNYGLITSKHKLIGKYVMNNIYDTTTNIRQLTRFVYHPLQVLFVRLPSFASVE